MQRRFVYFTLILGLTCLLGACGFQLRGTGAGGAALPDAWKTMHLVTGDPNSEFTQAVRTVFTTNDINWVGRQKANYLLALGPERLTQTNLSLNSEARVSQVELSLRASYSVQDSSGKEVIPEASAVVIRQMQSNPRNPVGQGEEVRILTSEMRTELAQQIVHRISFFATHAP